MPKSKLTPKQVRFVEEYLLDLDATNAARRAGYASKHAKRIAYGLLRKPHVERAVAAAQAKRAERLQLEADDVLRKLAELAYTDLREVVTWGAEGVRLIESAELSDAASATVCEVKETKFGLAIKRESRTRALEMLGKHLGLFTEKVEVDAKLKGSLQVSFENMSDEDLVRRVAQLRASQRRVEEAGA